MSGHERRQHFRIDDTIYFEYTVLENGHCYFDHDVTEDLLGEAGQRYLEATRYFQSLDHELAELTKTIALTDPAIAHYLNIINVKMDYIMRHLALGNKSVLRKVNLSLGGMSFQSKEKIEENTCVKLIIYTKPKMIPIIVNSHVVYSQPCSASHFRIAVQFASLTQEQEHLLSQHIMLAQVQVHTDS